MKKLQQSNKKILSRLQAQALQDQYQILDEIGRGSFAQVIKARQKTGKKQLRAIKKIQIDPLVDQIRQLQTLKTIRNDHIIQFYGYIIQDRQLNMIMKLCKGSLRDQMNKKNQITFTVEKIISLIIQVTSAMLLLNQRKIMHLDLKPQNILCDGDEFYKLCDFGCSQLIRNASNLAVKKFKNNNISNTSTILFDIDNFQFGTPRYIAPEIQLGKVQVGKNSCDIWSFGIILYELIYNKHPFNLDNTGKVSNTDFQKLLSNTYKISYPQKPPNSYPIQLLKLMLNPIPIQRITWRKLKQYIILKYNREQAQFTQLQTVGRYLLKQVLVFSNLIININDNICFNVQCPFWKKNHQNLENIKELLIYLGEVLIQKFLELFQYKLNQKLSKDKINSLYFILESFRYQNNNIKNRKLYTYYEKKDYKYIQQKLRKLLGEIESSAALETKNWESVQYINCFIQQVKETNSLFCTGDVFVRTCEIFDIHDQD